MRMHWTPETVAAVIIALFGFIGTGSGLILSLRINVAMGRIDTKIESVRLENATQHASVALQIEQLKTKYAENMADSYRQITAEVRRDFVERGIADEKHNSNLKRLDILAEGQKLLAEGHVQMREAIDRRLLSIEERLPV